MADVITISYLFEFHGEQDPVSLDLRFNHSTFALIREPSGNPPDWTRLDYMQCPHCPLDPAAMPVCPVAGAIDDVLKRLDVVVSHEKVTAQVLTPDRKISARVSVQRAFGSLFGLIIPACGCPHTAYLRPLARFHLPFASKEETMFRAASMYVLAQYFAQKHLGAVYTDFTGLEKIYENVHQVNRQVCKRLRQVCRHDSPANAIVVLDVFSMVMRSAITRDLEKLAPYFTMYLDEI